MSYDIHSRITNDQIHNKFNQKKFYIIECISRTDTHDDVIYVFTIKLITRLQNLTMRDFKTQYMG